MALLPLCLLSTLRRSSSSLFLFLLLLLEGIGLGSERV